MGAGILKHNVVFGDASTVELRRQAAKALAPLYQQANWRWTYCGIPEEQDIFDTLEDLARHARASGFAGTGGLCMQAGMGSNLQLIVSRRLQSLSS